jgi:hypothetical protein
MIMLCHLMTREPFDCFDSVLYGSPCSSNPPVYGVCKKSSKVFFHEFKILR